MAGIPFVDAHIHFYDLRNPDLHYSWLQPDWSDPDFGDFDSLKTLRYDTQPYLAEVRFSNVSKVVHVEAAIGIDDPLKETEWLQEVADRTGYPTAIVAHCDLADPFVESQLERHASFAAVRGIRDVGQGDYLTNPAWRRGVGQLARFGMVLDLDCDWKRMGIARELAEQNAEVPIILDHAGFPTARTEDYRQQWQSGLRELAKAENAYCKISALGARDPRWTIDSLRPWVLCCIDAFGPKRCMFGSNWPIERLYSSYTPLVDAYAEIISEFSQAEQEALFHCTAEHLYRI
ncbi:putative TIM-barrel fold metal-dependent hydrolase [Kribbella aluminosa]|uniref:TIM-barrel fold metal-dependent hydrolase n=1 Tax=Kribbella aluminosa TaxID=416017 RepID=A0ABS4UIH7_9ACTN|nr:amidohydrolase family protein [Kribbella aluminosa]MBP2351424.1 putative TIM-barrel fold metal-dependent hydrolase [Kribbella aluminosa]